MSQASGDLQRPLSLKASVTPQAWWPRCISYVTLLRQRPTTLFSMTALAVTAALLTALGIGYHFGQRAGSTPSTWMKRTSRAALCRGVLSLIVLISARRVRQSSLAKRVFAYAIGAGGVKSAIHEHVPAAWITSSRARAARTPKRLRNERFW